MDKLLNLSVLQNCLWPKVTLSTSSKQWETLFCHIYDQFTGINLCSQSDFAKINLKSIFESDLGIGQYILSLKQS